MIKVFCNIADALVDPLFEVFDGGDFILSSWRDVESPATELRIYFPDASDAPAAIAALKAAGDVVGVRLAPEVSEIPDEDWKFAYRKHFKTDSISPRLAVVPEWEYEAWKSAHPSGSPQKALILDPGMAFGTGQHATTRACLEYVDELAVEDATRAFLDVGCGSGILAIAAALEGFGDVSGFDVDPDAVENANENAARNGLSLTFTRGDLSRRSTLPGMCGAEGRTFGVVAANVLGPVLIRFAPEISALVDRSPSSRLILSGILDEIYPDVAAAYAAQGFREVSSRLVGEWRTGLFAPLPADAR